MFGMLSWWAAVSSGGLRRAVGAVGFQCSRDTCNVESQFGDGGRSHRDSQTPGLFNGQAQKFSRDEGGLALGWVHEESKIGVGAKRA